MDDRPLEAIELWLTNLCSVSCSVLSTPLTEAERETLHGESCSGSRANGDSMDTLDVMLREEAGERETETVEESWLLAPFSKLGRESWACSLGFELPLDGRLLLADFVSGLGGRADVSWNISFSYYKHIMFVFITIN